MPKNNSINLLPQEEFNATITGRILRWAMGTFRIIVIITEMIVMAAFLSRFWLDSQNSDLTNAIKIKSAQIAALASTEKEFRNIQKKVNLYKEIKLTNKYVLTTEGVISKLPQGITLTSISNTDSSDQVNGISDSESLIPLFINNLIADKTFKSVDLTSVGSSETSPNQTIFSIGITY